MLPTMRVPFDQALDLPPPFTPVGLRERSDAFTYALDIASQRGAGTLVHVGRFDLAEFAVVLEPDEPLRTARRAFYAGMIALSDAIVTCAPPGKLVTVEWPDAIRIDGGLIGGGRLGWPGTAKEDEHPQWLVFGAMIRAVLMSGEEPAAHPLASSLEQEGFGDVGATKLTEAFARHLMTACDVCQSDGFDSLAARLVQRLPRTAGVIYEIAENGDLLVRRKGDADAVRCELLPALDAPSWLDPDTEGPRL